MFLHQRNKQTPVGAVLWRWNLHYRNKAMTNVLGVLLSVKTQEIGLD